MIGIFYFYDNWFVRDENNRNLNNLFQKLVCSPSKVPISTRIILRNTSKRSRMFYQLLFTQNVQISIILLLVKSIILILKEWYPVSLTSNISAKNKLFATNVNGNKLRDKIYTHDKYKNLHTYFLVCPVLSWRPRSWWAPRTASPVSISCHLQPPWPPEERDGRGWPQCGGEQQGRPWSTHQLCLWPADPAAVPDTRAQTDLAI